MAAEIWPGPSASDPCRADLTGERLEPTRPLRHIFRELRADVGCRVPDTGCLAPWARRLRL